jgi:hypothetical protein
MENNINAEDRNQDNVTTLLVTPMEVGGNEVSNLQQIGNLRGRCCRCISYEESCRGLLYLTSIGFFCYGVFTTFLISTTAKSIKPFNLVTTRIVGGVAMMIITSIASYVTFLEARNMPPAANPRRAANQPEQN